MGLLLFIKHILRPPIQGHLTSAVLVQIQTERNGFGINRSAVKGCVDVLLQLNEPSDTMDTYRKLIEPDILRESEAFYKSEGERLLETCDAPEYLHRVRYPEFFVHTVIDFNAGKSSVHSRRVTNTPLPVISYIRPTTKDP